MLFYPQDKIDPRILRELLEGLAHEGSEIPLTVRSLKSAMSVCVCVAQHIQTVFIIM